MIIGFTGTRNEPTDAQLARLEKALAALSAGSVLRHGDCVGADAQAHSIARYVGLRVVVHPPEDWTHRAYCGPASDEVEILKPMTHLARNREIVAACETLLAVPCQMAWQPRGGTWYTVDRALKAGKPVYVIWPGGKLSRFTK